MASINLEELALKSIEQYAALNIHIASLQAAISDMNRRSEINQDKFSAACDKLARMEEKMSTWVNDRTVIHKRIDDTRLEVDKAVGMVKDLTENIKDHSDYHCVNCVNVGRVDEFERQLETHTNGNKDLIELRDKMTTPQGMFVIRTLTSRWGTGWAAFVTASSALTFVTHYEIVKRIWDWLHFN